MRVNLFKNTELDPSISMHVYADNLIQRLVGLRGLEINAISVRGRRLPFIKDTISKELLYPLYARFQKADVNHILDHSYGSLGYSLDPQKTVVTCHDLNPLEYQPQSTWLGRKRFLYNIRGMLRAKYIIADSESTKNLIKKHFNYKGNIYIVYLGINSAFRQLDNKKSLKEELGLNINTPYILHVGSFNPVKNVELILKALAELPDCNLIKVGEFSHKQNYLISELGIRHRIAQFRHCDENQFVKIYNCADILVLPSFCEGFGLPAIEAMACGCPVICSNTSSLPEIGGDAAIYIDPYSVSSLKTAIRDVLGHEDIRDRMKERGLAQANKFNWAKTAQAVAKIYEEIVKENK